MDIDILNYLNKDNIIFNPKAKNKRAVFNAMVECLIGVKKVTKQDKKTIVKSLLHREDMGSTAIGGGIALPHARLSSVKNVILCFALFNGGVDFDSLDQDPVNVIILLLSNQKEAGLHLKMLAFLARMLKDKYFIQQLKNAKVREEVLALINKQQRAIKR